jgi:hypothetical protein
MLSTVQLTRRPLRALVGGVLGVLLLPGSAVAATVTSRSVSQLDESVDISRTDVTFAAAAGEVNRVSVRYVPAGIVFRDAGAPLTAAGGCVQTTAEEVTCSLLDGTSSLAITVAVGDADDTVTLDAATPPTQRTGASRDLTVFGGPGADRLAVLNGDEEPWFDGGAGDDVLTGGAGRDTLVGGSGNDILSGAGRNDTLSGDQLSEVTPLGSTPAGLPVDSAPVGNDAIDGGPGRDTVTFTGRPAGVTVDLASGTAGTTGVDADALVSVENVTGTDFADVLLGDGAANSLDGGVGGRDEIRGRGGNDQVFTEGTGIVAGGPGNDYVAPFDAVALCGSGTDFLNAFGAYSGDNDQPARAVPAACERTEFFNAILRVPITVRNGVARLRIASNGSPLEGSATIRYRDKIVGRLAKFSSRVTGRAARIYRIRLSASAREAVARGKALEVTVGHNFFRIRTTLRRG